MAETSNEFNYKGPFYVYDDDFMTENKPVYKPAYFCKECGFFDERSCFCPMTPCIYFSNIAAEEEKENKNDGTDE